MEIHRRIQFEGNDTAYIRFLEAKVLELERILLSSLESHSPAPQSIEAGGNQRPSSRQYHTNEPANQSRGFQVIEYDPTRIDRAPTEKPSNSQTRLRWQSDLDSLLAKIPPLGHWRSNKQKFLEDGEITLRILSHADTLSYQPPRFSQQTSSEIVGLVPILHQYCDFAMKTSPEGDFYRKLVCFRELVFMSFCAVTLKTVGDAASVFEVMREYSGHDAQEKHLIKLTRGAIWANRSIFALSETQWRSDCSDIFLQAGQPVTFYARYAESSESLPYFLRQMRTKAGHHADQATDMAPAFLVIPLIIERLARGSLSLSQICEILGYDLQYIENCPLQFGKVLDISKGWKRRLESGRLRTSKRPRVCQPEPMPSPSDPEHDREGVDRNRHEANGNGEEVIIGTSVDLTVQNRSQSAFSPNALQVRGAEANVFSSDDPSDVDECPLDINSRPLRQGQGQGPERPGLPVEHLGLAGIQPHLPSHQSSSISSPTLRVAEQLPLDLEPNASSSGGYDMLDWENYFLWLDWEHDHLFRRDNWQDPHS